MEVTIKTPDELMKFVIRNDVSVDNAVKVCKVFFDADGIPFDKINTTKETVLYAINKRLENNLKGCPMLFCKDFLEKRIF